MPSEGIADSSFCDSGWYPPNDRWEEKLPTLSASLQLKVAWHW